MERVIESFNDSEKHDITLTKVKSAGKEVCGNDDAKLLFGSFLGLINGGYDDAADDYDDRDVEDALQPAADKLDIPVREDDKYMNLIFAAGLGAVNECEKECTGAQLEGAGGWFSLGLER